MESQSNDTVALPSGQQTNAPVHQKYGLFQSLQDMMGAVKSNPITFFGITLQMRPADLVQDEHMLVGTVAVSNTNTRKVLAE